MPHAVDYETDITSTTGFVSGAAAVRRRLLHRYERVRGEWAFDRSKGLLDQEGRPFNESNFRRRLHRETVTCAGVLSCVIESLTRSGSGGSTVMVSGTVTLESGDVLELGGVLLSEEQQNLPPTVLVLLP